MSLSTPSLTTRSETCADAVPQQRALAASAKPKIRFMDALRIRAENIAGKIAGEDREIKRRLAAHYRNANFCD
jgi:hypothetical protein